MTMISTGYVAYTCDPGELPIVWAYEKTHDAAVAEAVACGAKEDEFDVVHVDVHDSRHNFKDEHWLLFGYPYSLDGDVVVHTAHPRSTHDPIAPDLLRQVAGALG